MNNQNPMTIGAIALIIGLGGGFYGGMTYAASKAPAQGGNGFQRGAMMNGGQRNGGGQPSDSAGRGGIMGQIVSKDATSLTVKMPDGSSKIVFYSDSTAVGKATPGNSADLNAGEQIRANGKVNPDGSIAAQTIQIVPDQPGTSKTPPAVPGQ